MPHVPDTDRSLTLDVLRGVAVLGTFLTNVWSWVGSPYESVIASYEPAEPGVGQLMLSAVSNGRFLAMLAIVFGIGIQIHANRCARRGWAWPAAGLRRASVLVMFGAAHYLLLYAADVLVSYGLAAMVAVMLAKKELAGVRFAFTISLAVYTGIVALELIAGVVALYFPENSKQADLVFAAWAEQPYLAQVQFRATEPWALVGFVFAAAKALCLILGGMLMVRSSFLDRANWRPWAAGVVCLGIASAWLTFLPGSQFTGVGGTTIRYIFGPLQAVGYLVLIAAAVRAVSDARKWKPLANVGKCALSCYLLQSLLGAVFFFSYGLQIDQDHVVLFGFTLVAAVWAVSLGFAEFWSARGGDPAGRLLRKLADRPPKVTPMAG